MNFKAAIFDMDGTLVDSLMVWDVLWSRLGQKFLGVKNFMPSAKDDKAVRTLTLKKAMDLIHENYNMAKNGQELLDNANEIMIDFYKNTVKPKAGVIEFLGNCRKKGIRMCIASATAPDLIKLAAEHCGLTQYFEKIFSCAEIGKGKESPDIFLKACEYFGTKPEETCVFEDSLVAIQTAAKIGMQTVGIYDRYNFGQIEIKKIADIYVDEGENLTKLFMSKNFRGV